MTTSNQPKNQNPKGLHDLGQIADAASSGAKSFPDESATILRNKWWETTHGQQIRMAYYGTRNSYTPSDKAQISIDGGGFRLDMYLNATELRHLAADLCAMATNIEDARAHCDDTPCDIMKHNPDGSLTTEF